MNIFRDAAYAVKRVLVGLYGPADLDPEHDPVQQLKHEHAEEVKADEEPAAGPKASDEPTQLEKEGREDWSIG